MRCALLGLGFGLVACSHSPDTVVNFADSSAQVREASGAHLCASPCAVGMDAHQVVVLERADGTRFFVSQDSLGPGRFRAQTRVRYEPAPASLAVQAFSNALMFAGAEVMRSEREDRLAAGLVLSGLGTAGILASTAWPGKAREELWLERAP